MPIVRAQEKELAEAAGTEEQEPPRAFPERQPPPEGGEALAPPRPPARI